MAKDYCQLKDEASNLKPVSKEACRLFQISFNKIESFIEEKTNLDKNFSGTETSSAKQNILSDLNKSFGKLLLSVYELGLYSCLADEGKWYLSVISSRGFDNVFFDRFLFNWKMAIQSIIKPPESHELIAALDYLQRNIPEFIETKYPDDYGDDKVAGKLLSFLLEKNRKGAAVYALELLEKQYSAGLLFSSVLAGAMRGAGILWQKNEIEVNDVHVATDICQYVMFRIVDSFDVTEKLPYSATVICVPGEEHEMGAELAESFLELKGWQIIDSGHISPEEDMIHSIKRGMPDILVLSVTMAANLPSAVKIASRIRNEAEGIKIIAGGTPYLSESDIFKESFDAVASNFEETHNIALKLASGK